MMLSKIYNDLTAYFGKQADVINRLFVITINNMVFGVIPLQAKQTKDVGTMPRT